MNRKILFKQKCDEVRENVNKIIKKHKIFEQCKKNLPKIQKSN